MNVVKRIVGGIFCIVAAMGIFVTILAISMLFDDMMRWGYDDLVPGLLGVLLFALSTAACLAIGIRLIKNAKAAAKKENEITFYEKERLNENKKKEKILEKKNDSPQPVPVNPKQSHEEVPGYGVRVWKYKQDGSSANLYTRYRTMFFVLLILVAIILLIVTTIFSAELPFEARKIAGLGSIIVITLFIAFGSMWIGRATNAMMYCFAQDAGGRIYFFDYNHPMFQNHIKIHVVGNSAVSQVASIGAYFYSNAKEKKMIQNIDEQHIIEKIVSTDNAYRYGAELAEVMKIRGGLFATRVYIKLKRADQSCFQRSVVISKNMENYEQLLIMLQRRLSE